MKTKPRSDYTVVLDAHYEEPDESKRVWVVCATDLNLGGLSVTNDAEAVVQAIHDSYQKPGRAPIVIIYCDSDGRWDGLNHKEGQFTGFRPIGVRGREQAVVMVRALGDIAAAKNPQVTP